MLYNVVFQSRRDKNMLLKVDGHELDIDLTPHKRKKGMCNIIYSIIQEVKVKLNVSRLSEQKRTDWYGQLYKQLRS